MATTYQTREHFNESQDRLCENLLAHLNKRDALLETHWAAAHAEEYTLENGQCVQQIWGVTDSGSGSTGDTLHYLHFRVKAIAISAMGTEIQVTVVSPHPTFETIHVGAGDELAVSSAGAFDRKRLEQIADKVLEFCANPQAETDTGMVRWFRKLLAQSKVKRKLDGD
ncbi:MAG: hypothetical protein H6672_01255 [Anaerolineaceae bacterium]|nr:hypothetical protein [Anaerolineaceae bacterium]